MELKDRLKTARKAKKLTQMQVAERVGITQASYSGLERGTSRSTSKLVELANLFDVSPNWLATGQGQMTISHANVDKPPEKAVYFAPVLNWVQAGVFTQMGDNYYDEYMPHTYVGGKVFWLIVRGDSMMPDFKEGDYLLIDADKQPKAGSFVIARVADDSEATFKRYKPCGFDETGQEYWQLVPLNDFYPVIDSRHNPFEVVGVVVEYKRRIG